MVVWVMRFTQLIIAGGACAMALAVNSVYGLYLLCSDFVYVVLYPQLICVLFIRWSNSYGSLAGYVIGLLFRLLGGEPSLKLPPVIGTCGSAGHSTGCLAIE
jgi:high affinity choline transporter 7